jgi:phosphotransferase system HPr (HPr) family protein
MLKSRVIVINRLGLHARAAAQLVRLASSFQSKIRITRADNAVVADAKSILSVLTLAASLGVELEIEIEGADEQEALRALEEIFRNGFGEL